MSDYILCFDGSCQPQNPGGTATSAYIIYKTKSAGIGKIISINTALVLKESSFVVGKGPEMTCNVAEYHAVVAGLKDVKENMLGGFAEDDKLIIRGDSNLVIQQLSGKWKVRSPGLRDLHHEATVLVGEISKKVKIKFEWIKREDNARADDLADKAYCASLTHPIPNEKYKDSEFTQMLWTWLDKERPQSFWDTAGHISQDEAKKRFTEIPDGLKLLAHTMILIAQMNLKRGLQATCLEYRIELFSICQKAKVDLPYYWWSDAVMIEPEWIVKITNGIIGWTCDESVHGCNLEWCRYIKPCDEHPKGLLSGMEKKKDDRFCKWLQVEDGGCINPIVVHTGNAKSQPCIGVYCKIKEEPK